MANRSYLYSTNIVPSPTAKDEGRKLMGISEWNYDIPIVFKLLLSGNPRQCKTSIWDTPEEIALVGDYRTGVENLTGFLNKITTPEARPLIDEAIEFLNRPENQNSYFVLECGEIFDMNDQPLAEQNQALLQEIQNLGTEMEMALQSLQPPAAESSEPVGFFARLLGKKTEPQKQDHDPLQAIYALGLGNWSNVLYFDFTEE